MASGCGGSSRCFCACCGSTSNCSGGGGGVTILVVNVFIRCIYHVFITQYTRSEM